MTILFFVFLGVMAVAVGTTMFAIARAKDGYEDEFGFHPVDVTQAPETWHGQTPADHLPARTGGKSVPPDPVVATATELPSALLEGRFSP